MIKKSLGALLVGVALTLIGCPPPPDGGKTGTTTPPAGGTGATTMTPATTGDAGKTGTTAPATPPAPAAGIDLSHLKKGEKFTFVTQGGVQMVWTITDIVGTTVKYTVQSMMDMGQGLAPVGDPSPAEMPHVAMPATTAATTATPPAGTEISREKVKVGNVEFDCQVTKTGDSKTWTPMQGNMPVFPGIVKSMQGTNTTMELTKVEGN